MPQDAGVTLSELVRDLRSRRGITQATLAAQAGVSESMIANVESGKRLLGADNLEAVADALEATAGERAELAAARLRQKRATEPTMSDLDRKLEEALELLRELVGKRRGRGHEIGDGGTPTSMPRPALKGHRG